MCGLPVLYPKSPVVHGIDPAFLHVLQNWLRDLAQDVSPVERRW